MELEKLKTQLEEKDRIIHAMLEDMGHRLFETEKELLAKTREVQHLELLICNSKQKERQSSPSTELVSKPAASQRSSMGLPPMMGGESPNEVISASPAVPELRLVLMGKRAEDKRGVVEAILGTEVVVPQTQQSESRQAVVAQRKVKVVDTPDWFSPAFSQRLRQDVRQCMELSSPGPNVFLLVVPVDALEGEQGDIPNKMEDIFGETCWEYTTILFTSTEAMGQTRMEEFIKRNQELQQLVERCGKKCHFFDFSARDANVSILRTVEKVMSGNSDGFYDSQMYLVAEAQFREMETKMQQDKDQRKEKRKRIEKEMVQQFEKTLQESLRKLKEQIRGHEGEIQSLHERVSFLEREGKEEKNEDKMRAIEKELEREAAKREELEKKMRALKERSEKERKEMEAKHKAEMEELRERNKREARAVRERSIMKMLLSDCHKRISASIPLVEKNVIPFLGGHGKLKSLIQINKNNNEREREMQMQDDKIQMEDMCMEMANLSQALLEKIRNSAEKHSYRTSEE